MAMTGVQLAEANDDRFNGAWNQAILGFLELSVGELEAAVIRLERPLAGSSSWARSSPA